MRDAKASLTGKRPRPPYGGRANLQKSDEGRRNCVPPPVGGGQFLRSELGRTREGGPRPARGGGGQIRRRPSRVGGRQLRRPVRGATLTGPTLRANLASRIAGLFARTDAKIRRRTRPPPLAGRVCVRQFRLCERTYPPEGGERRSPIYTIYIRGSFARNSFLIQLTIIYTQLYSN